MHDQSIGSSIDWLLLTSLGLQTIALLNMPASAMRSSAAGGRRMSVRIVAPPTPEEEAAKQRKIKWIIWRDFSFVVMAAVAAHYMSYVELNASKVELRGGEVSASPDGIIDTGFIATTNIYNFLKANRKWNDIFAAMNSLILFLPGIYTAYVTFWKGDYDLAFRYLATHILRSFCGWFTYLPPDPTYLVSSVQKRFIECTKRNFSHLLFYNLLQPSNYDFPDIMQCLFVKDCSQAPEPEVLPFVSFFSGHVSTLVTTANHMYLHGHRKLGFFCHVMNVLQIIRLLATRGHYSIDMIIAWFMAVYVSNPAGRLGRYYSRGKNLSDIVPMSATEAFETFTGVYDVKKEARMSRLMKKSTLQQALLGIEEDDLEVIFESDTSEGSTATLFAEEIMHRTESGREVKKVS